MPFCAVDESANRINLLDGNFTKGNLPQELFCPNCGGEMIFVDGFVVTKHFRHKVECPYETEPETQRHLEMKAFIKRIFPSALLEQRIGNRIADAILPTWKISIENQVSSIGIKEIIERTQDHNYAGFSTLWIMGQRENLNDYEEHTEWKNMKYFEFFAKKSERFLHSVYYGRFYHYQNNELYSVHFTYGRGKKCFEFAPVDEVTFAHLRGTKPKTYTYSPDERYRLSFLPEINFKLNLARFNDFSWWKKIEEGYR